MSEATFNGEMAWSYYVMGQPLQYRNDPRYKGLPVDWTDVINGANGKFFKEGYQFRHKPSYQQRLAAQAAVSAGGNNGSSDLRLAAQMKPLSPLDTQVGGSHYKDMKIQPLDYISANNLGFLEGNAIKYITRYKSKGGIQDIEKAIHYLQLLIHYETNK